MDWRLVAGGGRHRSSSSANMGAGCVCFFPFHKKINIIIVK